jgi:hypothetical protein
MLTAKLRRIAAMVTVGLFVALGTMGSKCNLGLDGKWETRIVVDPYTQEVHLVTRCVPGGSQCWTDNSNQR